MSFRDRLASVMRSVIPHPPSARALLRERRLVAAVLRPGWTDDGPRAIVGEAELEPVASSLREASRIGDFATLFLETAVNPLTLEFEGGAIRTIRIGRPAERLGSMAILVAMDGGVFVAPGRRLGFLFAPRTEAVPLGPP